MPLSLYFSNSAWPHLSDILSKDLPSSLLLCPDQACLDDLENYFLARQDEGTKTLSLNLFTLRDFWTRLFSSLPQNYRPASLLLQRKALEKALARLNISLQLDPQSQTKLLREIARFTELKTLRPDWPCPKIYLQILEEMTRQIPSCYQLWNYAPIFAKLRQNLDRQTWTSLQKFNNIYLLGFSGLDGELYQSVETLLASLPKSRIHLVLSSAKNLIDSEGFYAAPLERLQSLADAISELAHTATQPQILAYPSPLHESLNTLKDFSKIQSEGMILTPALSSSANLLETYFSKNIGPHPLPSRLLATRHSEVFELLGRMAVESGSKSIDLENFSTALLNSLKESEKKATLETRTESLRYLKNFTHYLQQYLEAERFHPSTKLQNAKAWAAKLKEELLQLHVDEPEYARQRMPLRSLEHPGLKRWDKLWIADLSEENYASRTQPLFLSDADLSNLERHEKKLKLERCYFLGKEIELSFSQTTLNGRNQEISSLLSDLEGLTITQSDSQLALIDPIGHPYFKENIQREAKRHQDKGCGQDNGNLQLLNLSPQILKKLKQRPLSPSYIDDFALCPWRFFARWHLNLQDTIEEDLEIEARRRGQWAHRLLEMIFKSLSNDYFSKNQIPSSHELQNIFKQNAQRFKTEILRDEDQEKIPLPILHSQLDKIIEAAQRLIQVEWSDWQEAKQRLYPRYLEWSFGREGQEAWKFSLDNELSIAFSGIIDRIDVSDVGDFLVIDYKTSNSDTLSKRLREKRSFQLYIYLQAAQKILFPGKKPLGGLYWDLKDTKKNQGMVIKELYATYSKQNLRTHSFLSEEKYNQLNEELESELRNTLQKIVRGDYSLQPTECLNQLCQFNEICRYAEKGT